MATSASPQLARGDHFHDPSFTAEITAKMQVPKRIKIGGANVDDDDEYTTHFPWQPDKIDMRVPERILVAGQNKHIGVPAPPRELIVENTVMPPDPGMIRVQTPPRSITLDEHYFPSADDDFQKANEFNADVPELSNQTFPNLDDSQGFGLGMDRTITNRDYSTAIWSNNGPTLKTEEEVLHLRKQLVKLNRKVVHLEREYILNKQRDKIIFGLSATYFLIKFLMWMKRNN